MQRNKQKQNVGDSSFAVQAKNIYIVENKTSINDSNTEKLPEPMYPIHTTKMTSSNPLIYGETRKTLEKRIIDDLCEDKNVLLWGSGGIGKTSIARAIYQRVAKSPRKQYNINYVGWITYESSLSLSIYTQAEKKERHKAISDSIEFANQWLDDHQRMLLIIDNVDNKRAYEEDKLLRCLNNYPIWVLVTGRPHNNDFFQPFKVPVLSLDECKALFYHYYPSCRKQDETLVEIIKALCFHTITIELVAKIAQASHMKLEVLKAKLKKEGLRFSNKKVRAETYDKIPSEEDLIKQLSIVFSISNCEEAEKKFLSQMAVISHIEVDEEQLCTWFECDFELIESVANKGWAEKIVENSNCRYLMNQIVSQAILAQNSLQNVYGYCENFIKVITGDLKATDHSRISFLEKNLVYGRSVVDMLADQMGSENDIQLVANLLKDYYYVGAYREIIDVEEIVEGILKRMEENSCKNHILHIEIRAILGIGCQRMAKFDQAIAHYVEAVTYCQPEYKWAELVLRNNIISSEHRKGDLKIAKQKYRTLLDNAKGVWEIKKDTHAETIRVELANNYAALLDECAETSAIDYYKDAYNWVMKFVENKERDGEFRYTNVALNLAIYTLEGDIENKNMQVHEICRKNGLELMKEVMEKRKTFGKKLAIATAKHALALFCYFIENDSEKAKQFTSSALEIRLQQYDRFHPSSASSRLNLGTFCFLECSESAQEGIEIYQNLLDDFNSLSESESTNIRQIPQIIRNNAEYFLKLNDGKKYSGIVKDTLEEIERRAASYCKNDYQINEKRQLHESYGVCLCYSDKPNFIVNREVTNITIF